MDASQLVDDFDILNFSDDCSTFKDKYELIKQNKADKLKYVTSDADEELLIIFGFRKAIHLQSITFYAKTATMKTNEDISPPKTINIYVTQNKEVNFDDIADITPAISYECSTKKLNKGQTITLQEKAKVKFKKAFRKVQYLVVYVKSNQNDKQQTYLNAIKLKSKGTVVTEVNNEKQHLLQTLFDELNETELTEVKQVYSTSTYLVQMPNDATFDTKCDVKECVSKIATVLKRYYAFTSQQQHNEESKHDIGFEDVFGINGDDVILLLNDFHHLLSKHDHQFEEIFNLLVTECNDGEICKLTDCTMAKRQHRDRMLTPVHSKYSNDAKYRARQQILDKLHCHFFHTFDIGFRFTRKEKLRILDDTKDNYESKSDEVCLPTIKMQKYMAERHKLFADKSALKAVGAVNKFVLNVDHSHQLFYDYGYRYFYWAYYKNKEDEIDTIIKSNHRDNATNEGYKLKDWYVRADYDSLKGEMLNNTICTLGNTEWNAEFEKAQIHTHSEYAKKLTSVGKDRDVVYGIKSGSPLTPRHVVALMIYCNHTELAYKFSETYRKINNEDIASLKRRHSNFANMGRLLREFVDCYGSELGNHDMWNRKVYHGISIEPQFATVRANIKGPLSTTTDYAVATNFSGGAGVTLELGFRYNWSFGEIARRSAWIDCIFFSDYSNEQELLFIGGYDVFYFNTIIVQSQNHDYRYYVNAIKCIAKALSDVAVYSKADAYYMTVKVGYVLLLNRFYRCVAVQQTKDTINLPKIPKYVQTLFDNYCRNVTFISFRARNVSMQLVGLDLDALRRMIHTMFFDKSGKLNWDILLAIFPSLRTLFLLNNDGEENRKVIINESFVGETYTFLKNNKNITLERISAIIGSVDDKKIKHGIDRIIVAWYQPFATIGWKLQSATTEIGSETEMGVVLDSFPKINKN